MSDKSIPFTFVWPHTGASEVFVTGTFDNWSKSVQLDNNNGRFEKTILLAAEDVLFKFLVDGNWVIDTTKETMTDSVGIQNNVIKKEHLLSLEASLSSTEDANVSYPTIADVVPELKTLAVPKDEVAMKAEGKRDDVAANDSRPSTATSSSSKKSKKKKKKNKPQENVAPVEQQIDEEAYSQLSKDASDVSNEVQSRPTTASLDGTSISMPANAEIPEVVTLSEKAQSAGKYPAEMDIASSSPATEEPAAENAPLAEMESSVPLAESSHSATVKPTRAFDDIEPLEKATTEKVTSRPTTGKSTGHALEQSDVSESLKDHARLSAAREIIDNLELSSPTGDQEEGSIPDGSVNEESVQKVSSRPHTGKSTCEAAEEEKVIEEPFIKNAAPQSSSSKSAHDFVNIVRDDPVSNDLFNSEVGSDPAEGSRQIIKEIQKLDHPADETSRPHTAEKPANPIIVDQEFSRPPTAEGQVAVAGESRFSAADKFIPDEFLAKTETSVHDKPNSNALQEALVENDIEQPLLEKKEIKESSEGHDHTSKNGPVDIAAFNSAQPATDLGENPVGNPVDSSSIKEPTLEVAQEAKAPPASTENMKTFTHQLDNAFSTVRGKKPEGERPGSAHKDSVVGDNSTTRKDDGHEGETFFRKLRRMMCDIL